jgi:hypothetical protein
MADSRSERFQAAAHVHARRFDRDTVLLNLERGEYYSLDPIGATIWAQLKDGAPPAAVVEQLVDEYEVDATQADADVKRIAAELLAAGLLARAE